MIWVVGRRFFHENRTVLDRHAEARQVAWLGKLGSYPRRCIEVARPKRGRRSFGIGSLPEV